MDNISISKTKNYIEDNFEENIRLDDIAKAVGYSKYHLNRMFRESTNQSIYNYIRERRLYESAYQLANTDKSIVEIALTMRYSSQQAFSFAFKKEFGCTPQVYRNESTRFEILPIRMLKAETNRSHGMMMYLAGGIAA